MGDVPTTINTTANTVNSIVDDALKVGEQLAEVAISSVPYLSWLNLPIIHQLFDALMDWITNKISGGAKVFDTAIVISFQTNAEKDAYLKSLLAYQAAKKLGDPATIATAQQAWADAASSLIHSDGSAS